MRAPEIPEPGNLSLVDRLGRRSAWIFILLALLAACAYYLLASQTADERASAAEINLAGRRRMLSQQVGLLASQLQQASPNEDMADLLRAFDEMGRIHQRLITGTADRQIRPLPAALHARFYAEDGPHPQISRFLALGASLPALAGQPARLEAALADIVRLSRGEILQATDELVGAYQHLSEAKSDALRLQFWLLLIAALILLACSALGVLRPLIAGIRRSLADLAASETALRQSIAENRLILDTTDEGLFGVDRQGRIRFINPAAAQMLGVAPEALAGCHHHPAILDDADDCPICRTLSQQQRQQIEHGRFTRHGETEAQAFAVEYSVVPRPDSEGAVVSFRDISARLAAEARLERIRQRLTDAVEALDDAFALFDADDRLILYNLRFTEFFPLAGGHGPLGLSFAEFIREVAAHGLYAPPPAELADWLEERLNAHRQAHGSLEIACSDGRWLRATERRTREGGTVVIWSDVSHLKRALIAADRGSRAKSEFLSRMSHELRTPLNAIIGFAQVLEFAGAGQLADEQREYVAHILQGGRHLLSLINEVLDLSAIEAGQLAIEIEEIALAPLAEECLTLVSPLAADRGLRLLREIDAGACVLADRKRLKQVLLNLLSNAIKYNRPGGDVRICGAGTDGQVRLAIQDTGRGIPPELAERVFQPFDRLGREDCEGSGIGLAITRRLVELMGGQIGFDSPPGEGTRFDVTLPASTPGGGFAAPALSRENRPFTTVDRERTLISVGLDPTTQQMLALICRTLEDIRLLALPDAQHALAELAGGTACAAVISSAEALPALAAGLAAPPGRPPLIALAAPGETQTESTADHWHPLPLHPRQLARTLRTIAHAR